MSENVISESFRNLFIMLIDELRVKNNKLQSAFFFINYISYFFTHRYFITCIYWPVVSKIFFSVQQFSQGFS